MNKKVVFIGPAYPYRGGQALLEAHWHSMLKNAGYDPYTVTYSLLYPSIFFPGKTQFDESGVVYHEHNNRIFRLINSINPFSWLRAYKKIKEIKPDAIILVWWMSFFAPCLGTIGWLSKIFLKTKIILLVENYISHEKRLFDHFLSKRILHLADEVIVQSKFAKPQIEQDDPHKSIHEISLPVYDCFDSGKYNRTNARNDLGITTDHVILFFGYIREYKGLKNLLKAYKPVLEKFPSTTLLIVGEFYDNKTEYMDIIENEGIAENIKLIDRYVSNEEVEIYFKASDIVILPYNSATQSGIVMLAYAFKRPLIATNVGGLGEFIEEGKTGYVIPPFDLQALSNKIIDGLAQKNEIDFEKNISDFCDQIGFLKVKEILKKII